MRYLLPLLAACASGWKEKAPEPDRAPDSRTEYSDGDDELPALTPATMATRFFCSVQPHATAAGVTIAVANGATFKHDLCLATDRSIGLLSSTTGLGGVELEVTLQGMQLRGVQVRCRVRVGVRNASMLIGTYEQAVSAQASSAKYADLESSKRDCVDANIDDLVRQRAVPAILRHASASSPSTSP